MPKKFSLKVSDFDLGLTLDCGQAFRWNKIGDRKYSGVIGESIVEISQDGGRLSVLASNASINHAFMRSYLGLDDDLTSIYNDIAYDINIKDAIKRFRGLRILRQPFWECLASFIISAYNNIPRIKGIIYRLGSCSGNRIVMGDSINYSFPAASVIAGSSLDQLGRCGLGYRAPFLKKAAMAVADGKITAGCLKAMTYPDAKEALMRLDGVGQKVSDCVLLYSIGKFEAFPVDVWIKRIMENFYFKGKNTTENKIREFAVAHFGQYAGYAQQYLYYYGRINKMK